MTSGVHTDGSGPGNGEATRLGMVVSGSLADGVEVKLDPATSIEDVKVGRYVTIEGDRMRFFGVVTDVSLGSTDPSLKLNPPDVSNPYVAEVVSGTTAFGMVDVEPVLTLAADPLEAIDGPQPAKTVPAHFSAVSLASDRDVQLVFGSEDERHFFIGNPLDMETRLCLDMEELVRRSAGVFGKTGTGKTFLTRLLLIGILKSGSAVNLVFDMQSEYGWKGYSEDYPEVKGLKQLFSSRVAVFSLDEDSSRRRGLTPDYVVRIGYQEIEPEDIQVLRDMWDLSDIAVEAAFSLERRFGSRRWLGDFLALDRHGVLELAEELGENQSALSALYNRLGRLRRLGFMDENSAHDSVGQILDYLNRGIHVVLEFGRYGTDVSAYVLVANLLTRRIHESYAQMAEAAQGEAARKPRPLVITIEEAHKYLSPGVASQTIFGAIAREMRKHNVTLLVVDQRPSGIDPEVMSQLGTKITCQLDNETDVNAVLAGVSGGRKLRGVLSRLESKQQALVFGHALPMPVVIHTREYGTPESYRDLGFMEAAELKDQMERDVEDLFGPTEG